MALRAMCKYSTLLTPSPSRESRTLQRPYWYRLSVTESSTFPMRMLLSEYGAGAGLILVEPLSVSQGGGVIAGLVIADSWFVGAITDNSESSLLDSNNHCFQRLRWSSSPGHLMQAFPQSGSATVGCLGQSTHCILFHSGHAGKSHPHMFTQPNGQVLQQHIHDPDLYSVWAELHSSLLTGKRDLFSTWEYALESG